MMKVFDKLFPNLVVIILLIANNYMISANYTPENFGRDKLIQKKYRCIRYYQDKNDYNKLMEKTCIPYKMENDKFNEERNYYDHANILISVFGTIILLQK